MLVTQALGLISRGNRVAEYADARTETVAVTDPMILDLMGRDTLEEALVLGDEVWHLAEYSDAATLLADRLDAAASADDYFGVLQAVAPLYRAARHLHAALQRARELMPDDREIVSLRDQAGEIERAAELIYGDAKNGLDFTVALRSEEQAQRGYEMAVAAHRLNLLAAIFFPIATLSAIFGMNLEHGLGIRDNPAAFWTVLAVGFIGGVLLTGVITSKPARPEAPGVQKTAGKPKRRAESRRAAT